MANKPKTYDLKAADRRRNRLIQLGLTAIVIIFAVGMVLLIVKPWDKKGGAPGAGEKRPITVSVADKLIKDQAGKPKVVLSMYEDFLCPHCADFEQRMGPTVRQLIAKGAVQADYYMVSLPPLDRPQTDYYSSRAGNAGYCVAEADTTPAKEAFQRFHDALYKQQPSESATSFPSNAQLIETARQAGLASQQLSDCINKGKYTKMVQGLVQATGITYTPTIRVNGEEFKYSDSTTPQDLINKVTQITGAVPGLTPPAPTPAPAAAP